MARQAEYYYDFIGQDLKSAADIRTGRSHIFIFRDEKDWNHFVTNYGIDIEWAFSLVRGMTMYLQQSDSSELNNHILGHEMTHLVFNRFYPAQLPLWLNEGTAEWYGEFAHAAYKGIKKSKRQIFRRIDTVYPIEQLVEMTSYPSDPRAVQSFYETSKCLVGFLQLNYPPAAFEPFLASMAAGANITESLNKHFGITTPAELKSEFKKFVR